MTCSTDIAWLTFSYDTTWYCGQNVILWLDNSEHVTVPGHQKIVLSKRNNVRNQVTIASYRSGIGNRFVFERKFLEYFLEWLHSPSHPRPHSFIPAPLSIEHFILIVTDALQADSRQRSENWSVNQETSQPQHIFPLFTKVHLEKTTFHKTNICKV